MRRIIVSTLFLLYLFATTTFAHTNLKASNPIDGQIVEEDLDELTLQFETPIANTSLLTLTSDSGKEIPVTTSINNDTMIAKILTPLENGTYQVSWNIIGEDGHPMSGSYLFMVSKAETSDEASESGSQSSEGSKFNWFMLIIGAIVLIIILSLFSSPNKRRRRF